MATNSTDVNSDLTIEDNVMNSDGVGTDANASLSEKTRKRKHSLSCDGDDQNKSFCPPLK